MALLITTPDDGTNKVYHVVDLEGNTVVAYRDAQAAINSMEGDQRLFVYDHNQAKWIGAAPAPEAVVVYEKMKEPITTLLDATNFSQETLDKVHAMIEAVYSKVKP